MSYRKNQNGFTIVELLIVVVVIAILAAITIVAYNGVRIRSVESSLQSNLSQAGRKIANHQTTDGSFPSSTTTIGLNTTGDVVYDYVASSTYYCLAATQSGISYVIKSTNTTPVKGSCTPAGDVTTFAGSGTAASVDGTGTSAQFNQPISLAFAPNGTLYVSEQASNRIRAITPGGVTTTLAGSSFGLADNAVGTLAQFRNPRGLSVAPDGTIYVADQDNHRIRKVTPSGSVSTFAGSSQGYLDGTGASSQFRNPAGTALASDGSLYVTDFANHCIRKITPAAVVTTFAGTCGTFGYADNVVGTSALFGHPSGIAVDSAGTVYVADYSNHRIRKITPSGSVSTFAGSTDGNLDGVGTAARFTNPASVVLDQSGTLYVGDYYHKVRRIGLDGTVTTLTGANTSGYADGNKSVALFNRPAGFAIAPDGSIYVADLFNHRIRVIR